MNYILDCVYTLNKYNRGAAIDLNGPALVFYHHWQKFIMETRGDQSLDPYPSKHMANLDVLITAIQKIIKNALEFFRGSR